MKMNSYFVVALNVMLFSTYISANDKLDKELNSSMSSKRNLKVANLSNISTTLQNSLIEGAQTLDQVQKGLAQLSENLPSQIDQGKKEIQQTVNEIKQKTNIVISTGKDDIKQALNIGGNVISDFKDISQSIGKGDILHIVNGIQDMQKQLLNFSELFKVLQNQVISVAETVKSMHEKFIQKEKTIVDFVDEKVDFIDDKIQNSKKLHSCTKGCFSWFRKKADTSRKKVDERASKLLSDDNKITEKK